MAQRAENISGENLALYLSWPQIPDDSWSFTLLHAFGGGTDGMEPYSLIIDQVGNFFGTTLHGGVSNRYRFFADVPAMPPPITTKSVSAGRPFIDRKW